MSSLATVVAAMKTVLDAAIGETTSMGCQVTTFRHFNPTTPSIDIYPAAEFRSKDLAGFGNISGALIFTIRARVSPVDSEAAQTVLLELMDDESAFCVADVLMDDQTLGGTVSSIDIDGPTGYALYADPSGEGALLGVEWTATIVNASAT